MDKNENSIFDDTWERHFKELNRSQDNWRRDFLAPTPLGKHLSSLPRHRSHEPFADILALACAGLVWWWCFKSFPHFGYVEPSVIAVVAGFILGFVFRKLRRLTKLIGYTIWGGAAIWLIVTLMGK